MRLQQLQQLQKDGENHLEETKKFRVGTKEILIHLRSQFPGVTFRWVLGADAYRDLCAGKWRDGDGIVSLANLEVVQRDGQPTEAEIKAMKYGSKAQAHYIPGIASGVSSTKARKATSRDDLKGCVSLEVADFIVNRKLYSFL